MSEPVVSSKLTGANFSAHRIASVAPSTFAQVFGIAAPAFKQPFAEQLGQYVPLNRDVFIRSNNNVRFSGQSVQAQFAEFARAARIARFSGLGVTKNKVSDGNHTLLYQFASTQAKPSDANHSMAALRVTHPAFGNGPIHVDVVNYRQAPHLNQNLTLHNSVSSDLPRLDFGAEVPAAPNLVRFGNGTVVSAKDVTLTQRTPHSLVQQIGASFNNVTYKLPSALRQFVQWMKSAINPSLEHFSISSIRFPLTSVTTAVLPGQSTPQVVQPVTAMRFGNNVVEVLSHKGPAATAQTFVSLKEASAGISTMANQLEQERGFSRIAEQTVSHFAAANKFSGANPYSKSLFASNPFASVAFAGASKSPPVPTSAEAVTAS